MPGQSKTREHPMDATRTSAPVSVSLGVALWAGLYLRVPRLRALVPLESLSAAFGQDRP